MSALNGAYELPVARLHLVEAEIGDARSIAFVREERASSSPSISSSPATTSRFGRKRASVSTSAEFLRGGIEHSVTPERIVPAVPERAVREAWLQSGHAHGSGRRPTRYTVSAG